MRLRCLICLVAVTQALPAYQPASAQPVPAPPVALRGHVVVLRPPSVDELTRTALARVTGELTAARFRVSVVPLDMSRDPIAQVETVAPELSPVAAFAIAQVDSSSGDTIAIWVCDRLGKRTTIQRMSMHGANISQDAEVLAVEAIELIRVSIAGLWPSHVHSAEAERSRVAPPIEAGAASDRPTAAPAGAASNPSTTSAPITPPNLVLALGLAGLQDLGPASTQWLGLLDAMVAWPSGFALRAQVRGLGPSMDLSGNGYGTASVNRQLLMLGAAWIFFSGERVQTLLGAAVGTEHLTARGSAVDAQRTRDAEAWSFAMLAGAGASFRLRRGLAVSVEIDAILALPPVRVRIADIETKSLSLPGVLTNVALQATF